MSKDQTEQQQLKVKVGVAVDFALHVKATEHVAALHEAAEHACSELEAVEAVEEHAVQQCYIYEHAKIDLEQDVASAAARHAEIDDAAKGDESNEDFKKALVEIKVELQSKQHDLLKAASNYAWALQHLLESRQAVTDATVTDVAAKAAYRDAAAKLSPPVGPPLATFPHSTPFAPNVDVGKRKRGAEEGDHQEPAKRPKVRTYHII